jgi:peptidoglycan/xylan/chitin deacetylase (PgdA/CDA1 family)
VILLLHGTADPGHPHEWEPLRHQLSPTEIDTLFTMLTPHYTFIPMDAAVDILAGRRPPVEHALVVTFDDGYRSNIVDALPVLQKHRVPMTVFLPVSNIESREPLWVDRLDYALQQLPVDGLVIRIGDTPVRICGRTRDELRKSFATLRTKSKAMWRSERDFHDFIWKECESLEREGGSSLLEITGNDPWSALLSWEEVMEAAVKGVVFGSHAQDHFRLGLLSPADAIEQLRKSRDAIASRLGSCRYLAYPDGNYNEETKVLAKECGYEAALTTDEGRNTPGCDLMSLKRTTLTHMLNETDLRCRVSGFYSAVSITSAWNGIRGNGR